MTEKLPEVTLSNGTVIPQIGFGTYLMNSQETIKSALGWALANGYRHIDTAEFYHNEAWIGETIRDSAVSRDQLFITSKVWNNHHSYEDATKALDNTLKALQTDYVDLYLIHFPTENNGDAWRALIDAQKAGKARAIGVSNFAARDIEQLTHLNLMKPMVNQIEFHPAKQEKMLSRYLQDSHIVQESYSPLGHGKQSLLENPVLQEIAANHNKTTAQIALRWNLQLGNVVIPKSVHPKRLAENQAICDFSLSADEMAAIAKLDEQTF